MKNQLKKYKYRLFSLFLMAAIPFLSSAQAGRKILDLSNNDWSLWLDTAAKWQNDSLFVPPVSLNKISVNIPSGGWSSLSDTHSKAVHLPATVEEYFWGLNGSKFGVTGNYLGVSWFSTKVMVPADYKGKHISLQFESVRFRAEVFVNEKLVGYDLVNGTPFDVDISASIKAGQVNTIAVRITDPNGNFDWRDSQTFMWGNYRTQPSHGFGGITGKVKLMATDKTFISDVFVKNTPQANKVDVQVSLKNATNKSVKGKLLLDITEKQTGKLVYTHQYLAAKEIQHFQIEVIDAKLWDIDHPNLYNVSVAWKGDDGAVDTFQRRFGFRWFEVKDINGDQQFYLNNKRIVLRTAISWGFWPLNGITPSDSLAYKQVEDAKQLGLNMLNFHRTIGQTNVLDAADELGLLYFEEPGGNQYPENLFYPDKEEEKRQTAFYMAAREAKFNRMILRDRSHPSLVIYNMHNERGAMPQKQDSIEMLNGHHLDDSRIITYNSSNGSIKLNEPDPRFKLHLFPYNDTFYSYGWFDQHHAGGPGVYHDALYSNPHSYAKFTDHKDEIVYYGEEGAIGTPPRLQLIRDEILKTGKDRGWETDTYLKWYDAYDRFLKENNFTTAFANVDNLTRKMGNVAYYYQGRVIENVRINNTIDGYAVNGWESMKQENHSGIVDDYRNLKGDADLIARYNKPLYVAVKLNHKVVPVGDTVKADFYIVNEKNISGDAELEIKVTNNDQIVSIQKQQVNVEGGNVYGQLLLKDIKLQVKDVGYTKVTATLSQHQQEVCSGDDEIFAVQLNTRNVDPDLVVADTTGALQSYLQSVGIKTIKTYKSGRPQGHTLVAGAFDPQQTGNPLVTDLLEWVNNGNTLVIVGNIEKWAPYLAKKEVIDFRGMQPMGTSWYGGNYFSKESPLFNGLPQACVFNWEYQCLATYNKNRIGMRMYSGETIVGAVSDHKQEVYSALGVVRLGRGKIILNALDLLSCIRNTKIEKKAEGDGENASMNSFNATAANPANIVGQQLLLNLLKK
jgi:hypothetical protein